jgi:competence protein ComGC
MLKASLSKAKGFTLLQLLFVLVLITATIIMMTNYGIQQTAQYRADRTGVQMQQLLNAGLAYYVYNGSWPTQLSTLTAGGYLPATLTQSSYGYAYTLSTDGTPTSKLTLQTQMPSSSYDYFAMISLIPNLPNALIVSPSLTSYLTAAVDIPGQNTGDARTLNFSSVYHSGGCVPVPSCPSNMTAQIVVVPAGVNGVKDPPTTSDGSTACSTSTIYNSAGGVVTSGNCAQINSYPITNYGAYTTGPSASPQQCNSAASESCWADASVGNWTPSLGMTGTFWRVCLTVQTEKGQVVIPSSGANYSNAPSGNSASGNGANMYWAQQMGYIFAFTRCTPTNPAEPSGSTINVWSN